MDGLGEGCKEPYSQQVGCIIKLALTDAPKVSPAKPTTFDNSFASLEPSVLLHIFCSSWCFHSHLCLVASSILPNCSWTAERFG
jgi:hypothetical protein